MITLLLLAQITREEFLDFKRQTEVQFAEIRGEINEFKTEMRSQIQALNQRVDISKCFNSNGYTKSWSCNLFNLFNYKDGQSSG